MDHQPEAAALLPLILAIRNRRVILDSDLAALYGVSTKRLNEQVRRNTERFPADFAFRLNAAEARCLRSHFATSKKGRGGRRHLPFAFTEHGAVMAANVLNSKRAIAMSVEVVRAFVRLRRVASSRGAAAKKLADLERAVKTRLDQHDQEIEELFETVESLIDKDEDDSARKRIGFLP